MDKDVQDAFKLLGNQITEGFVSVRQEMATKQDLESIRQEMATKQDLESIRQDVESIRQEMATKQDLESIRQEMATKQDVKRIIREEVQDIRNDIEARCSPSKTE